MSSVSGADDASPRDGGRAQDRPDRPESATAARSRAPALPPATAPDELLPVGTSFLGRRVVAYVSSAVLLLAAISVILAWRQYDDAKSRAVNDLDARVVAVSALVDTSFADKIATLDAIAKAPAVVDQQHSAMSSYFRRLESPGGALFSGGLGWGDLRGRVLASNQSGKPLNVASRLYFRHVLTTGQPYVSAGLIGRRTKQPIVVIAAPTYDRRGRISGVLVGSILLKPTRQNKQSLNLGFGDLQIMDRNGRLLLSHLDRVPNTPLLRLIQRTGSGVIPSTRGLDGNGDDVVAYSTSKVAGWVTLIDRPRSSVFAPAVRALILDLVSVAAGVLLVLALLLVVIRRSRRDAEQQNARARSWGGLTRSLAAAARPSQVADALLETMAAVFTDAVAVVAFDDEPRALIRARSRLPQGGTIAASRASLEAVAALGGEGRSSRLIEHEPRLASLATASGKRFKALHTTPILGKGNKPLGTIALLSAASRLDSSDWALLGSFADQTANALERALVYAHEHELAVRLQRSLLPDRLPGTAGVELAGHYLAGGDAIEVGGDWYDAVRRPDGIIQLCVGDVSGKGIGAATVMGRQRNTFHVYAHDYVSPAEIMRRMLRHTSSDEMITVACVSVDPYTNQLTYACAGHPPPLLLDRGTGEVMRLDRGGAPPFGIAEASEIVESQLELPERAVLAMYTDGLVERRGANIDEAIDVLGEVIARDESVTTDVVVTEISRRLGAPDDDVALLLLALDRDQIAFVVELPAVPASPASMRRRLRAWLAGRRVADEQIADILLAVTEACNNAIEHAYRDGEGTIKLRADHDHERLRIVIEDDGAWREPVESDERGHGIRLMKELMDSAEIESTPRGTRVTLELRVPAGTERSDGHAAAARSRS